MGKRNIVNNMDGDVAIDPKKLYGIKFHRWFISECNKLPYEISTKIKNEYYFKLFFILVIPTIISILSLFISLLNYNPNSVK